MIIIIGAGPSGSHCAYKLAKKGYKVKVFENHKEIGRPIQCTGILTETIYDVYTVPKEVIVNRAKFTKVFSPSGNSINIKLKGDIIVNRDEFDKKVAEKAMDSGVEYEFNSTFTGLSNKKAVIKTKNGKKELKYEYLIGADGPNSSVAKAAGIFGNRKFFVGVQAAIKLKKDSEIIDFYPHVGQLGWVTPESDSISRVGVCAYNNARNVFWDFCNKTIGKGWMKKVVEWQSGLIPVYDSKLKIEKDNIYLIGDAAAHVKATTAGGIIQGMHAAEAAAESIETKKSFTKLCNQRIKKDLDTSLFIRKVLDSFTDKDYDRLVRLSGSKKAMKVWSAHDRDKISSYFLKLVIAQPGYLSLLNAKNMLDAFKLLII